MKIGMIGLGRMGYGMSERLLKGKHNVVAYNRSPEKTKSLAKKYNGATATFNYEQLLEKLPKKKIVWLMLPAGKPTDDAIKRLIRLMNKGDIIIDGANDFYKNAEKHSTMCKKKGINFFDCGVSGGVWGLKNGFTLMIGGPKSEFKFIEPFCKTLSPKKGYGYFGPAGSGHFVKSVHNIVEYTYLQGLAEGVELLSKKSPKINLKKATEVWKPASVIRSWLLDLTNTALNRKDFKIGIKGIRLVKMVKKKLEEVLSKHKAKVLIGTDYDFEACIVIKLLRENNIDLSATSSPSLIGVRVDLGPYRITTYTKIYDNIKKLREYAFNG